MSRHTFKRRPFTVVIILLVGIFSFVTQSIEPLATAAHTFPYYSMETCGGFRMYDLPGFQCNTPRRFDRFWCDLTSNLVISMSRDKSEIIVITPDYKQDYHVCNNNSDSVAVLFQPTISEADSIINMVSNIYKDNKRIVKSLKRARSHLQKINIIAFRKAGCAVYFFNIKHNPYETLMSVLQSFKCYPFTMDISAIPITPRDTVWFNKKMRFDELHQKINYTPWDQNHIKEKNRLLRALGKDTIRIRRRIKFPTTYQE